MPRFGSGVIDIGRGAFLGAGVPGACNAVIARTGRFAQETHKVAGSRLSPVPAARPNQDSDRARSEAAVPARPPLKLLLVAANYHLASSDLRQLVAFLNSEECPFLVSLEIADPARHPELLELHRLVATPALVKLLPEPRQVFAGTTLAIQVRSWLPRWRQMEVVSSLGLSLRPAEIDGSRTQREVQLEDQLLVLRQENETLIERLGVQERLLRMVAHELRTPLTAAKLALQSHGLGQIDEIGRAHV